MPPKNFQPYQCPQCHRLIVWSETLEAESGHTEKCPLNPFPSDNY